MSENAGALEGCTMIIIPHDIDKDPTVVIDGVATTKKFDQIGLRHVLGEAERIRLDIAFERQKADRKRFFRKNSGDDNAGT